MADDRDVVQLSIRMPRHEHEALKRASAAERRSVNQHLCAIVADRLASEGYLAPVPSRANEAGPADAA